MPTQSLISGIQTGGPADSGGRTTGIESRGPSTTQDTTTLLGGVQKGLAKFYKGLYKGYTVIQELYVDRQRCLQVK